MALGIGTNQLQMLGLMLQQQAALPIFLRHRKRMRKQKQFWVRPWITRRQLFGDYEFWSQCGGRLIADRSPQVAMRLLTDMTCRRPICDKSILIERVVTDLSATSMRSPTSTECLRLLKPIVRHSHIKDFFRLMRSPDQK